MIAVGSLCENEGGVSRVASVVMEELACYRLFFGEGNCLLLA